MREKRLTIKDLAKIIGISPTSLFNKIHNHREFLASEVQMVGNALELNDFELRTIFFA